MWECVGFARSPPHFPKWVGDDRGRMTTLALPLYLCPKEVAAILGVSPRSASRLMASGHIESFRVGTGEKGWRTTRRQVDEYAAHRFELERQKRAA